MISSSLIDAEVDDVSDSSDSDDHPIKISKDYSSNLFDDLFEKALLVAINGIVRSYKCQYNIVESISFNNLKSMLHLICDENFFYRRRIFYSKSFDELIELLNEIDPIFRIKLFNFKDPKYAISSAISINRFILNRFFLKKSRDELFERCSTIIFAFTKKGDFFNDRYNHIKSHKKNPFNDRSILFEWETYVALVYFANYESTHFMSIFTFASEYYFKKADIPQIIDENFLKNCNLHEQDAMFYQLQFIFNALDKKDFSYRFNECLLITIKKLKLIKVPDFKTLAANIKSKNISLIKQMKKYEEITLNKKDRSQIKDQNTSNAMSSSKPIMPDQSQPENDQISKTKLKHHHHHSSKTKSSESFSNQTDSQIVECLLIANKKLRHVKVPKFKKLAKNINAKKNITSSNENKKEKRKHHHHSSKAKSSEFFSNLSYRIFENLFIANKKLKHTNVPNFAKYNNNNNDNDNDESPSEYAFRQSCPISVFLRMKRIDVGCIKVPKFKKLAKNIKARQKKLISNKRNRMVHYHSLKKKSFKDTNNSVLSFRIFELLQLANEKLSFIKVTKFKKLAKNIPVNNRLFCKNKNVF